MTRTYRWLQQCRDGVEREQVDDDMIDFSPLVTKVILDSFYQPLPSSPALIESHPKKREREENKPGAQKKRKDQREEGLRVSNEKMIAEWKLRPGEKYAKFAGEHLELRPKVDGKYACTRWHVKGYCFANCKNKNSHFPSHDAPQDFKEQFEVWVKTCRGE